MAIQISFLVLMVIVAVASTRLIYHDGITRHYKRMGIHCKMLAAMIVTMAIYAGSIGFKIHEYCLNQIEQKDSQLRSLSHQISADGMSSAGEVVLTTSGGNKIILGDENGLRNGAGDSGCSICAVRRSDCVGGCERSGVPADSISETSRHWASDDGIRTGSELLEQLRRWTSSDVSRADSISAHEDSVSF